MWKTIFLYLTIACFFGLIAIFVVDGYMGVYDTIYAAQYVRYLSEVGKLVSLLLTVGMFAFLGKYFEGLGW